MKLIFFILCVLFIKLYSTIVISSNLTTSNDKINIIKCIENTGTGREDIFKINNPSFQWKYKSKWYELAESNNGVSKDWKVVFNKSEIELYNNITKWRRVINLKKMAATMNFPTGEKYLYKCKYINK